MKRFFSFIDKIDVHPLSIVFISLILFSNFYKLFFIYFMISFIHELGHVFTAFILRVKVRKITLLPIGFNATIEGIDYLGSLKDFLITISGPLTYFISLYLLNTLYNHDYLSLNAYMQAVQVNNFIFLFNMLPIYPLDGGRIFHLLIDYLFTIKRSFYLVYSFSLIFSFILIYLTRNNPQWMIYFFLLYNHFLILFNYKHKYKAFLVNRYYITNHFKDKLHDKKDLFRNKNNFIIEKGIIYNEKEAIKNILLTK